MAKEPMPDQFKLIYSKDNFDGMLRLMGYWFGDAVKLDSISVYIMILSLVDEACAIFVDADEIKKRLDALEEGTIRLEKKTRIPQDKYYAVLSGLQHSTVYCAEDKKTGRLLIDAKRSRDNYFVSGIALSQKAESDRYKAEGRTIETKMPDFISRCENEGWDDFMICMADEDIVFSVEEYKDAVELFDTSRNAVNHVLDKGIPGNLLFPALVTYMYQMIVDVRMKDGREFTGCLVSLLDNFSTVFTVLDLNGRQSMFVDPEEGELEWLRVYMTDAPDGSAPDGQGDDA
ncbi:MAG: hypothetical protein LUE27_08280 [Clostridia bacterium]|nr:hypothetical protein [Clostridia bacterium]